MSNNFHSPKVSARPPEKKDFSIVKLDELSSAFIKDGSMESQASLAKEKVHAYPWQNARNDLFKTFNLRLPEDYAVKLEYVAMRLKISKHSVCMNVVKKEIDSLLEEVFKSIDV